MEENFRDNGRSNSYTPRAKNSQDYKIEPIIEKTSEDNTPCIDNI